MVLVWSFAVHTDDVCSIGPHMHAHVAVNVADRQMITLYSTQH